MKMTTLEQKIEARANTIAKKALSDFYQKHRTETPYRDLGIEGVCFKDLADFTGRDVKEIKEVFDKYAYFLERAVFMQEKNTLQNEILDFAEKLYEEEENDAGNL